ncbi:MAG: recombinase family protein [Lachnospiraceae bacterium]|nr:recombinase family protein [Lachnospiraceae bacterium]
MSIGIYLRLSLADGDICSGNKKESNSIENQRVFLHEYIKEKSDLSDDIVEYIDDGYTGSNFNRPAFKQMITDTKNGTINTIIVKDLSRLGRDYIEMGDYIDQIFPRLGIRLIAVNSNYDSINSSIFCICNHFLES